MKRHVIIPAPPGYKLLLFIPESSELTRSDVIAFQISTEDDVTQASVLPITATETHQASNKQALLCPDGVCYHWQRGNYDNEQAFLIECVKNERKRAGEEK